VYVQEHALEVVELAKELNASAKLVRGHARVLPSMPACLPACMSRDVGCGNNKPRHVWQRCI
jgi:hypothetical protein